MDGSLQAEDRETGAEAGARLPPAPEDPWRAFLEPADPAEFLAGWLAIVAERLETVEAAALFLRGDGGRLGLSAVWRLAEGDAAVAGLVEALARKPEPLLKREEGRTLLGYPVEAGGALQGVLVLALARHPGGPVFRRLMRELYWSCGWIENRLWQGQAALGRRQSDTARLVLTFLSAAAEHQRFDGAALALVNAVPGLTGFRQAALGMVRGGRVRLEAVARGATFARRSMRSRAWEAAMDEALAQGEVVAAPARPDGRQMIDMAHRALLRDLGLGVAVSVPLAVRGRVVGVLTLGQGAGDTPLRLSADAVEDLRLVAAVLAPLLEAKHRERRLVSGRLRDLAGRAATAVLGRRPAIAAAALALAGTLVLPALIRVELRVAAEATVEGAVQQAAVAPVEGFIAEAPVRAGDRVQAGDLLARLDDQDLQLERDAAEAQAARVRQAQRDALAGGDRAAAAVAAAELDEALAALDLIAAQQARLEIRAPISGLVVAGDLSQRIGAPVQRGEVLFELAEESGWRLAIRVSEYDLGLIAGGETGEAVFAGLSGIAVPFEVAGVSAVAEPGEGENRFRVEARVTEAPPALRPGLQGTAKIAVGESSLAWAWLRGTVVRLRLMAWRVLP